MLKGYITNLGKYNEGCLVGKYIEFPIDEDELNEVYKEIGICHYDEDGEFVNTGYEEIFFTDWECDFSHNFGEYESIDRINEIAETLEEWDADVLQAACEIWDINEVLDHDQSDYVLYYDVNDDNALGYYWLHESGCYDMDINKLGILINYIDYESLGRDISLESNGGFTSLGWVEFVG
jgi:antirestriction protein